MVVAKESGGARKGVPKRVKNKTNTETEKGGRGPPLTDQVFVNQILKGTSPPLALPEGLGTGQRRATRKKGHLSGLLLGTR